MSDNQPVWQYAGWPDPPALHGDAGADVCVIGLGGSGLSCVGELLALGRSVVGLDAGPIGGGAAGRNGGFLLAGLSAFYHQTVAALGRERAAAIYRRTLAELDRMTAECPQAIRRAGSLRIAASPEEADDCRRHLAALLADDFPAEAYDGPEGRGLLVPSDGAFNPLLRCRLLAERAQAAGAQLFSHSAAIELGAGEVRTAQGRVRCRHVVVAVDGGIERVLPELAGTVRSVRLQMLACAPDAGVSLPRPVYRRWGYDYWQQLPDGAVAVGGFRDIDAEAERAPATPSAAVQAALERLLRDTIGARAAITHRWAAHVGYTRSPLPRIAEVRRDVWAIGGYNGTGNVVGALCGRGVAQMIALGQSALVGELVGQ